MRLRHLKFETIDDDSSTRRLSIIITGNKPEIMINETKDFPDGANETVQISCFETEALYKALHEIFSAKT
jgi:hypothetical protein